jgi:hypothetical protein
MTSTTLTPRSRAKADYLNLTLWTFQGWIAMFFIAAGYAKLTESMENLTVLMHWPALASVSFVRGLGVVEIVLAVMMLAPLISWRFGRPLLLTASVGLLALQSIMLILHATELDIGLALTNLFLIAITAPVFWFRRHLIS